MENRINTGIQRSTFIKAMSQVAATVSVVTTGGRAGRFGATVSSLVSVSADTERPTILVCLQVSSNVASAVFENGNYCVNVLGRNQARIADVFAGRNGLQMDERFAQIDMGSGSTGAPRLKQAIMNIDCQVSQVTRVGLHDVVFGEVCAISFQGQQSPLLYANRNYASLQPPPAELKLNAA